MLRKLDEACFGFSSASPGDGIRVAKRPWHHGTGAIKAVRRGLPFRAPENPMSVRHSLIFLFGGALGTAMACGGSSVGDEAVPIEEVPQLFADTLCTTYETCLGGLLAVFLPGESCSAGLAIRVEDELPRLRTAIDNDRIVYNGTRIEACLQELQALGSDAATTRFSETCAAALGGTVALGDQCSMDEECQGAAYCDFSAACPGMCTALKGAGGMCDRDNQCASGLTCSDVTGLCVTPPGPGDRCEGGTAPDCGCGLICVGNDNAAGIEGNCRGIDEVFSAQVGAACNPLMGQFCAIGLACVVQTISPVDFVCQMPVASGAACRPGFPDPCPPDEYCSATATMLDGTCTAKPGANEPCVKYLLSDMNDPPNICAPNLRCDGGTCRERQHLGAACTSSEVCYSDNCVSGGCRPEGSCDP